MSLSFRLCTPADIPAASALLVRAYGFTGNREEMLHGYYSLQPDGCWLALLDGTPVGFGGAVNYGTFSYIGMICVEPAQQHHGIGEALTRQIIAGCEAQGCPTMFLEANPKALSLYKRLGFVEDGTTLQLRLDELLQQQPLSADVTILQAKDLSEVVQFDMAYFGGQRERVLAAHLQEYPRGVLVTRDENGAITGYVCVHPRRLGPWVACTVQDAEKSMCYAFALHFECGVVADIPANNEAGRALLERYGFREAEVNIHMRRGPIVALLHRSMIYGLESMALG